MSVSRRGTDLPEPVGDAGGGLARSAYQRDSPRAAAREVLAEFQAEVSGPADDEHMLGRRFRGVGESAVALHDSFRVQATVAESQLRLVPGVQCREDRVGRFWHRQRGRQIEVTETHAQVVGADATEARTCRRVQRVRRRVVGNRRLAAHGHQPAVAHRIGDPGPPGAVTEEGRDLVRRGDRVIVARLREKNDQCVQIAWRAFGIDHAGRGAKVAGRMAQRGGQFAAGPGVIHNADGARGHQGTPRQPHPLLDEESCRCGLRAAFRRGVRFGLGQDGAVRLPQPGLVHPGVREIEQWQGRGTVGLGAQAVPRVVQVVNGQLREIAGELAQIESRSGGGADHDARPFVLAGQGGEIVVNRQLQCRVLGQFDEGVDAERRRGGDCFVEANDVAQVPEPVLVDREVLRDGTAERGPQAADLGVQEFRVVQFVLRGRAYLFGELVDQAGVRGISDANESREGAEFGERIDDALHRFSIARNPRHTW